MTLEKRISCIVLDAAPLLLNQPSISTLLATAEELYTVPAVIAEVKDLNARQRLETTVLPFLISRTPSAKSIEAVSSFARKSGDYAVLSRPDIQILALAYELECEKNHGDWRLRNTPGQKRLNGSPPAEVKSVKDAQASQNQSEEPDHSEAVERESTFPNAPEISSDLENDLVVTDAASSQAAAMSSITTQTQTISVGAPDPDPAPLETPVAVTPSAVASEDEPAAEPSSSEDEGSDSEGWITPSNLKRKQQQENRESSGNDSQAPKLQVATISTDFALQNVLLRMNLNLLSSSLARVSHLKSHILRCHACFKTTKEMERQFCDRCGQPTLTRVTCSTLANGEFKLHLKTNMQWNNRGNRYSIPKPVSGTSSGKAGKGGRGKGGKGGWGSELILSEDQKEYTKAVNARNKQQKKIDLMDADYLPGILTGERGGSTGKIKIGAGRDVNSKRR